MFEKEKNKYVENETLQEVMVAFYAKNKLDEVKKYLKDHKNDSVSTKDILNLIEKDSKTYTIETRLNQKEYNVLYGKMLRFSWHRYNFNTLLQITFGVNKRLANSVIKALYQLKWYEYC